MVGEPDPSHMPELAIRGIEVLDDRRYGVSFERPDGSLVNCTATIEYLEAGPIGVGFRPDVLWDAALSAPDHRSIVSTVMRFHRTRHGIPMDD